MTTPRKSISVSLELVVWSSIAFLLALWSASIVRKSRGTADTRGDHTLERHHSWIGDDYPAYYPMMIKDVIMFPEDTMHYPISGEDALRQWETQFPMPGEGWVFLGPECRPFALTMYHELHCLGRLRLALEDSADRTYEAHAEHVQHCLNYLRMMTLCRADVTLEPVADTNLTVDLTQPHLCNDWFQVYEEASRNVERCMKQSSQS